MNVRALVNRRRGLRFADRATAVGHGLPKLTRQWLPPAARKDLDRPPMSLEFSSTAAGYRLTCVVHLPASRREVFDFFSDATQLERLTPPWLKFSVLTPTPILMGEETLIDYKLRVHGIPLRWQSRISCWEPPFRFADEQVRGPYQHWHHLHSFEEDDAGTICRDEVNYSFLGGKLMHTLFVKRDLEKIFAFRTKVLQQMFSKPRIQPSVTNAGHSW
ncbi:MAG: SRPBCC family protein [Bythopirellula sp.]|nr:SRPBCC family protein [Bythopirellula sp.]